MGPLNEVCKSFCLFSTAVGENNLGFKCNGYFYASGPGRLNCRNKLSDARTVTDILREATPSPRPSSGHELRFQMMLNFGSAVDQRNSKINEWIGARGKCFFFSNIKLAS